MSTASTSKILKYASIFGIISLLLFIPGFVVDATRWEIFIQGYEYNNLFYLIYVPISFLSLITWIVFIWGFKVIGEKIRDDFLVKTAYALVIYMIIDEAMDVVSLGYAPFAQIYSYSVFDIINLMLFGIFVALFGVALLRHKSDFGDIAIFAGILSVLEGISFVSVYLSFVGLFFMIPAYVFEIMLLFRASKTLK